MFNCITIVSLGLLALTTAKPYTSTGSSQLDVRNNYNSGSGYSTSIGYVSPLASRFVASASPFAYSAPFARYSPSPSVLTGPFSYGPPTVAARYESPLLAAGYASPYAAQYASPYAQPIAPFAPNFATGFASPYTTAYASPYTIGTSGSAPILL